MAAQEGAANDGLNERRSLALSSDEKGRAHKRPRESCLPDEHDNEPLVSSLIPVEHGQSNQSGSQYHQEPIEDAESLSRLVMDTGLNSLVQSPPRHHRTPPSDTIARHRNESVARDMVISKRDRLLHRHQSGGAATPGLELINRTAEFTSENKTYANPVTVN